MVWECLWVSFLNYLDYTSGQNVNMEGFNLNSGMPNMGQQQQQYPTDQNYMYYQNFQNNLNN